MNLFCRAPLDPTAAATTLQAWMQRNHYWKYREWAYKPIRPRILAECWIGDPEQPAPPDYKMFCFHGVPRLVQVDTGRFTRHTRDLYALPWRHLDVRYHYPQSGCVLPPPPQLESLLKMAAVLSEGIPFIRIDAYDLGDRIVFGECTWYPEAGLSPFTPATFDAEIGAWLTPSRIDANRT